jgi:hypothetical protein
MKHLSEEQLIAYQDGETSGRDTAAAHINSCTECQAELNRLAEMLAAYQALPVPDPGEDYGRRVWQQIAPRLKEKRSRWWQVFLEPRRLTAAGLVAALLLVAFLAGRVSKRVDHGEAALTAEQVRQRVLLLAVGEHPGAIRNGVNGNRERGTRRRERETSESLIAAAARGRIAGRKSAVPADRVARRRYGHRQCAR